MSMFTRRKAYGRSTAAVPAQPEFLEAADVEGACCAQPRPTRTLIIMKEMPATTPTVSIAVY